MKKILFAAFAVVAMGIASCDGVTNKSNETADSTAVDTTVVDSVSVDSVAVDSTVVE